MQPVGSGLTFGTNQVIVSSGKTSVIPQTTKIVGVGTTTQDIRSIPSTGIGSTGVVVNVLTIASVCGAAASLQKQMERLFRLEFLKTQQVFRQAVGRGLIFLLMVIHLPLRLLASPHCYPWNWSFGLLRKYWNTCYINPEVGIKILRFYH